MANQTSYNQVLLVHFIHSVATRVWTPIVEQRIAHYALRRQYAIGGHAIFLDVTFAHVD